MDAHRRRLRQLPQARAARPRRLPARQAAKSSLKDLLPVFDNLERAIQSAQRATDVKAVADGLSMVIKQFVDTLGRVGITKVPTVGTRVRPAHPRGHPAGRDRRPPAGTVVAEVQPGYVQGERLVRAAMVVVAKPKTGGSDAS